jgi:hypothetical protein
VLTPPPHRPGLFLVFLYLINHKKADIFAIKLTYHKKRIIWKLNTIYKGEGINLSLCLNKQQATEEVWVCGDTGPRILYLGTRHRSVCSSMTRLVQTRVPLDRRLGGSHSQWGHLTVSSTAAEKQTVLQMLRKFCVFCGKRCSLPCSQQPATRLHHKPDKPSPRLHLIS